MSYVFVTAKALQEGFMYKKTNNSNQDASKTFWNIADTLALLKAIFVLQRYALSQASLQTIAAEIKTLTGSVKTSDQVKHLTLCRLTYLTSITLLPNLRLSIE